MTPIEMAAECVRSIPHGGVVFTVSRGKTPKGFPRGEVLNEMERNGVVEVTRRYDPEKVLAWLIRNGGVRMERRSATELVILDSARSVGGKVAA